MSALGALEARRLGIRQMYRDHRDTWTQRDGEEGTRDRRAAATWFFGVPTVLASVFLVRQVHLEGLGQLLSGVAVFTALLFGLLVLMFNTGVTLRKDGTALANAHGLRELVADLRANTTWAIVVGFSLALILVVAAASTSPQEQTPWGFTPIVVWLAAHLTLTLLTILRRFRTAFNYITR